MKNNIETQEWHSNEKQQSYNNENHNDTREWKNENRTTIIQQSFKNEKLIKQCNEAQEWKTTLKHSNEKQQS